MLILSLLNSFSKIRFTIKGIVMGYVVDRVHVERVFPLGQYASFRVRLEA